MKKTFSIIFPLLIFLISFLLRLSLISKGPYHVDCLNLALKAQETLDTGILQNLFGSGYPLTVILGAFFIWGGRLFSIHDPVIMVNLMSVVFSSLALLTLFFLAQKIFDTKTGFLSACLFSVTPIFLGISVYGKSHAPSIFFLLLSLLFLFKFKDCLGKKDFWLSAIFFSLMGASRLQDMILMLPSILFLILSIQKPLRQKFLACLQFTLISGVIVILFHLPYFLSAHNQLFQSQLTTFWQQGVTNSFQGLVSPLLGIAFEYFFITMTLLGLLLSLCGLIFIGTKNYQLLVFLLLWFFAPLFFYGNGLTVAPRLFAFSLIPLFLAQGVILSKFFSYKHIFRLLALTSFLFLIYSSLSIIYPPLKFRQTHALLPQYAQWVKKTTPENAVIILSGDHSLFMAYYGNLNIIGRPPSRSAPIVQELTEFKNKLDSLMSEGKPVYISFNDLYVYDPLNQFAAFLTQHYNLKAVGGHFTEFWHKGAFNQLIFYDTLFKVIPKS